MDNISEHLRMIRQQERAFSLTLQHVQADAGTLVPLTMRINPEDSCGCSLSALTIFGVPRATWMLALPTHPRPSFLPIIDVPLFFSLQVTS